MLYKLQHQIASNNDHYVADDIAWQSELLRNFLNFAIVLDALAGLANLVQGPAHWAAAMVNGGVLVFLLLFYVLIQRGYSRSVSNTLVFFLWANSTINLIFIGGLRSPAYMAYFIAILLAGLLLGVRSAIVWSLLSITVITGVFWAELSNRLPPSLVELTPETMGIGLVAVLIAGLILINISVRLVNKSLAQTRHELSEHKRAEEELSILYDTAMLTVETTSFQGLFEQVSHRIDQYMKKDLFSIWLLDEADQTLYLVSRHYHGESPDWMPEPIPLHLGIVGTVAATGQAMRAPDVTQEPLYRSVYSETKSELCVPMRIGERVVGALNVESHILGAFSNADERLLTTIASQLATATQRLRTEEALRASEDYYRSFMERFPIGVYRVTPGSRGKHLIANAAYLHMFGIASLEEMAQNDVADLYVNPAERKNFSDTLLAAGHVERVELHLKRADGTPIWGAITASVAQGKDGEIYFDCAMEDITERKRAEDALQISEERLQQAVRAANIGIYDHDHLSDTIYWSSEQRRNYGWDDIEEIVVLDKFFNQVHPDDRKRIVAAVQKAHDPAGDGLFDVEHRIIRRDGEIRWLSTRSRTQFEGEGMARHPTRTIGAVVDITERKLIETEREKMIKELEARNAELERLAYTISHDLKNPLVTIRGFLGFLERDAMSGDIERLKADMSRISVAVDKMQRLLHDLLDLLQIGHSTNSLTEVPFETIVYEALALITGSLTEHNVLVDVDEGLPNVYGDQARLVEVIQNLMENSIKFMGDQVQPHIKIGQRKPARDGEVPILFIQDNGMGINPRYHQKIFGLFDKLDVKSEGTGIGLALVKRIIETQGGKIWVESEGLGKGSTFCFTIPARRK